jgi:hypothetical protein
MSAVGIVALFILAMKGGLSAALNAEVLHGEFASAV